MVHVDKTDPSTMSAAGCLYHLTHDWNRGGIEITGERWPEAEPIIMTDPRAAYIYVSRIINKGQNLGIRWPEAEPYIMKDPEFAYDYAKNIINRGRKLGIRWPEAEPYIMQSKKWAAKYNKRIIRHLPPDDHDLLLRHSLLQNIGSKTSSRGKTMKFKCEIDMDNEAFENDDELPKILRQIITELTKANTGKRVKDTNGNFVGQWSIEVTE